MPSCMQILHVLGLLKMISVPSVRDFVEQDVECNSVVEYDSSLSTVEIVVVQGAHKLHVRNNVEDSPRVSQQLADGTRVVTRPPGEGTVWGR